MSYEMSVDSEWLSAACILKLRAMFLCFWRICVVCLALELVGPCVVLGFSVGMESFDELLLINVPWSQEFSGVLQDLDLSLLLLVFSLILTVASRLLHRYSTNDKKSRLKMISFSTVRDTWRGSQSYMEKRGPAISRFKPLRFRFLCTPQRRRLGWACILCPSKVRAARATRCLVSAFSQLVGASYHLLGPSPSVSWVYRKSAISDVSLLGSWSLTATLLADVNRPGSQEDLVSNWGPAHSLVEDAFSGAEIAPYLPALAVACLPLCLRRGDGPVHNPLALLWYLLSPLFCEQARQCLWLELSEGKFSFFFSLPIP